MARVGVRVAPGHGLVHRRGPADRDVSGSWADSAGGCIGDFCGRTLFEVFRTADPEFPPIAAHRRALAGVLSPVVLTLAHTTFHGYVAPLRVHGGVAGCVTSVSDYPRLDARASRSSTRCWT